MICNKCGTVIEDGAVFCKECGAKQESANISTESNMGEQQKIRKLEAGLKKMETLETAVSRRNELIAKREMVYNVAARQSGGDKITYIAIAKILMGMIAGVGIAQMLHIPESSDMSMIFPVAGVLLALLAIFLPYLGRKNLYQELAGGCNIAEREVYELTEKMKKDIDIRELKTIVPEKLCDCESLEYIINSVKSGRCREVNQAINEYQCLYEKECRDYLYEGADSSYTRMADSNWKATRR